MPHPIVGGDAAALHTFYANCSAGRSKSAVLAATA
jgi:hypothetical protein